MLDSEALYTLIGGLKPMSSGFVSFSIKTAAPDTAKVQQMHRVLSALRCGREVGTYLLPFGKVTNGKRPMEGLLLCRSAVQRTVKEHAAVFAPLGITADTEPIQAALLIERDGSSARHQGLGYLYGYPDYAVEFYVRAMEELRDKGALAPRERVHIPTFGHKEGKFVYVVPQGHLPNEDDRRLRQQAQRILEDYRQRRARYIGEGKPGVVALLRDWFDDGNGYCSPANARIKGSDEATRQSAPPPPVPAATHKAL